MKHQNLFVLTMMLLMCLPSANAQNTPTKKSAQDSVSAKIWDGDYGEIMPRFPGGDAALFDYIKKNLRYPQEAKNKGYTRSSNRALLYRDRWQHFGCQGGEAR